MNDLISGTYPFRRSWPTGVLTALLVMLWFLSACNEATENRPAGNLKPAPRPIDTARIWHELYPADHHFDEQGRLTRTIVRRGKSIDMVTAIGKVIPYNAGFLSKALVVLNTYDVSGKSPVDCRACFPEMDLAFFQWETGDWQKVRFDENWAGAGGAWGRPAQVFMDSSTGRKLLHVKSLSPTGGDPATTEKSYALEALETGK